MPTDDDNVVNFPEKTARTLQQEHLAMFEPMHIAYQCIPIENDLADLKCKIDGKNNFKAMPMIAQLAIISHLTNLASELSNLMMNQQPEKIT
jgi:hypothetical protein